MTIVKREAVFETYQNFINLYRLKPATAVIRTAEWHHIPTADVDAIVSETHALADADNVINCS